MSKPSTENLDALVRSFELNTYQKASAQIELRNLNDYMFELLKKRDELLEMLQDVVDFYDSDELFDKDIDRAEELIQSIEKTE